MSFIQRLGLSAYALLRAIYAFLAGLAHRMAARFKPSEASAGAGKYDIILLGITGLLVLIAIYIVIREPALLVGALVLVYARGGQDSVQIADGQVLLTRGTVQERINTADIGKGIELFGVQSYTYGRISFFVTEAGSPMSKQLDALAAGETPADLPPEDATWNVE